jgi:hypothetical protein
MRRKLSDWPPASANSGAEGDGAFTAPLFHLYAPAVPFRTRTVRRASPFRTRAARHRLVTKISVLIDLIHLRSTKMRLDGLR